MQPPTGGIVPKHPVCSPDRRVPPGAYALLLPFLVIGFTTQVLGQGALEPLDGAGAGLRETLGPSDPTLPPVGPRGRVTVEPDDLGDPDPASRTAPNYGKRRPLQDPRLAYPGQRRESKRPLPRTEPYTTSPREIRRDYSRPPAPPPPTTYAQPAQIPRPLKPRLEQDPYAPLGIGAGSLRLYPFVETSAGYDDNPNRRPVGSTAPKQGSAFSRVDGGFRAQSNWSVHEFTADLTGGYLKYFNVDGADRPEGRGKFNLRLDAARDTRFDFELRGSLTTQRPGSPELITSLVGRPPIFSYGATGGVTRNFGRLETTISALVDRTTYDDGRQVNGVAVKLSDNNFTAYGLRGRIGYEVTPGIKPFVEVTADTRQRDEAIDAGGFRRNSNGLTVRAGSSFELTRTLTGEISAGYLNRKYDDARLAELHGPTIDGRLVWTATPLTTVTFRAATTANETLVAGASGYLTQLASFEVSHALLRNLTLSGIATWQSDRYRGVTLKQDTLTGTLRAEYALTRSLVVRGSFTHERLKSSTPGADYTANVYLLGLRLQR